jgi:hypothetical protein
MKIQLTEQESRDLAASGATPPILVDPCTQITYVLIPRDEYDRMSAAEDYVDSPWTAKERDALALEAGKHLRWGEMTEYDEDRRDL